jgi:hypothetical protein
MALWASLWFRLTLTRVYTSTKTLKITSYNGVCKINITSQSSDLV